MKLVNLINSQQEFEEALMSNHSFTAEQASVPSCTQKSLKE